MLLSRKFVSDYIDLDENLSITDIAESMTSVGNEYDYAGPLINATKLVTGEVIECENHPDSDHTNLSRCGILCDWRKLSVCFLQHTEIPLVQIPVHFL